MRHIESKGDHIKIITDKENYLLYHMLKKIMQKIEPELFLQYHCSYPVAFKLNISYGRENIILTAIIPIGQFYK
ncbi:LytTR family transcriptional regulator DNA-binding domain-containing protein [Pedobacter aquatilis]|uniref:LytTR family transcriptional regulator DNA-binding domain-containing protein n=1 Tax=Pedobacter aquatilis TaxID=351343 RepID=UPI003977647A